MAVHWTDDPSPTPLAALHHHSSSHDRFGIRNLHFRKLLCFLAPLIWHFLQMVSCSAKCVNDLNCTWISVYVWFRSHETSSWSIFVRQLTRPKMIESWSILLNDSRLTIEVSRWGDLKRWHDTTNHNLFIRNSLNLAAVTSSGSRHSGLVYLYHQINLFWITSRSWRVIYIKSMRHENNMKLFA